MSYDANSIQVKDFRSACRSLPGMYLGASGTDAVFNAFLEILNNSCDEAMMGRGNKIIIDLKDNEVSCTDFGAGAPRGSNKDCEEVLIEIYTSAHSSGKFSNEAYKGGVRGCFGIGASAVCVCCKEFEVITKRDGGKWHLLFKDGIPQSKKAECLEKTKETGTRVRFVPDKEIFGISDETSCFDYKRIKEELINTSYFIPNVSFILNYNGKTETFLSKNGLKDFAEKQIKNPLHKNYIYGKKIFPDETMVEVFAQWTKGKEKGFLFSNGALNIDGGTPISGAKAAFSRTVNSLSGKTFDSDMIRRGLVYIVNVRIARPVYQNQVKNRLLNNECKGYTQTVFTEAIKDFAKKNPEDFDKIIGLLDKEQRADEAAEKARNAILSYEKKETENKKKKIQLPDKFKDCEKHGEEAMLVVCEGNSALAGLLPARDVSVEALYAVRGKVKNLLKHPLDECLENQEVSDIIMALGCGIQNKYNSKKLNYGKVAIAVDADSDGFNIMCLISTLFWVLMPDFIKEGRLCWLRAPLYHLTKNNKRIFAYNDEELKELKKKYPDWSQGRMKGLGEMTAEDMELSMMNKKERRLEVLTIHDVELVKESIEMLMGTEVEKRRDFLFENVDFSKINN